MSGPLARLLPDGRRLHLQHGPIDLVMEAWGAEGQVAQAYERASARFATVLDELVAELPALRRPAGRTPRRFAGPVAARMEAAVQPLAEGGRVFLTPMAAVAGAVADEVLAALVGDGCLGKAYVNNGGDAALYFGGNGCEPEAPLPPPWTLPHKGEGGPRRGTWLGKGEGTSNLRAETLRPPSPLWGNVQGGGRGASLTLAVAGTGRGFADRLTVRAQDAARGVATSGWRGRSFSLGIADAVTVLAKTGAAADAAATLVANAVDLPGHPNVARALACALSPDSDLGSRLVTVGVGALAPGEVGRALAAGLSVAEGLRRAGRIEGAALFLAGDWRVCGALRLAKPREPGTEVETREAVDA